VRRPTAGISALVADVEELPEEALPIDRAVGRQCHNPAPIDEAEFTVRDIDCRRLWCRAPAAGGAWLTLQPHR
jgi:hypothetical protein